jgi:hypothetical protein
VSSPRQRAARPVPKHRAGPPPKPSRERRPLPVRRSLAVGTLAVAATGVAVAGGVLGSQTGTGDVTDVLADVEPLAAGADQPVARPALNADEMDERRRQTVSRSDARDEKDEVKQAALEDGDGPAASFKEDLSEADPRTIARALMPEYGLSPSEFGCLDSLYVSESDWRIDADNPTSSAYGIPQALTETHDMPEGYFTSAEVQIRWGLEYIKDSYGTPCNAWAFKQANNWY